MSQSGEETVAGGEFGVPATTEWSGGVRSRESAELILAHLPAPLLVLDEALVVRKANLDFLKTYGLAAEEVLDRPLFAVGQGSWDIPLLRALLENVVRQGAGIQDVAVRHNFTEGETRLLLLNARRVTDESVGRRILLIVRDFTERGRAEEALRRGAEQFAAIFNQSTSGIVQLDLNGQFVLANDHFVRIAGRPRQELLELRLRDLVPTDEQALLLERLAKLPASEGGQFMIEHRLVLPEGRAVWVRSDFSGIRDPAGKVQWVGVVVTDMTEIRAREAELRHAAEELERADRSKDEFLAMLAHELRNPLAPLRNAAELLGLPELGAAERDHALGILTRQIENMSRMVDDLLDVSRITEGKIALRRATVELQGVVRSALDAMRPACQARNQALSVCLPEEPVYVLADSTRLEQVLGNLLGNACKYGGEGCRIDVTVALAEAAAGPEVELRVRDNGIGIAPELLPRVFELFMQATRSLDRAHGGLGIGLTLVDRLVRLHGGTVEAHSEGVGRGSEFVIRLPRLAQPPKPAGTVRSTLPAMARRLLVVDDNADSAQAMAMLQRARGHEVRTAGDGPQALELAQEFRPEVVLLDIGLPGMDGFEVARRLRAEPAQAGLRIYAMSGYRSDQDLAQAEEAGFDAYLVKPVDLERLRELLAQR
ncbi:MAG: PAS domain-containing protein [Verrucomicrobia bacterium]|nr:PAS domain-containing protein [Verrucomicrobiota bacterium]